jgi:hypothetical protein
METARREALPYLRTKYETYARWGQDDVLPDGETFDLPIEALTENRFVVGDPAHCIEQITMHRERLSLEQMSFRVHWPGLSHQGALHAIELLGEHVLPHFKV